MRRSSEIGSDYVGCSELAWKFGSTSLQLLHLRHFDARLGLGRQRLCRSLRDEMIQIFRMSSSFSSE